MNCRLHHFANGGVQPRAHQYGKALILLVPIIAHLLDTAIVVHYQTINCTLPILPMLMISKERTTMARHLLIPHLLDTKPSKFLCQKL